jgi:hypothetical protein
MRLLEVFNTVRPILLEGIDHPEDLIISSGSAGADRVVAELIGLQKDNDTISIKWDGFPAVVFGRDKDGTLVFMDKHMFDKVATNKMNFTSIKNYDLERGSDRSDLWQKESIIRPALEEVVPNVRDQYWMGDLMYTGTPQAKDGFYSFTPNTVEYQVKIDSPLGKQIGSSVGSIAVHTSIPGLGQPDVPLKGLGGLKVNAGIVFLTGEIKDRKPKVSVDPEYITYTKKVINDNRQAVDNFISELTAMKGKSVITSMGPFITNMLSDGDISNEIVPRFLEFLKSRLTPSAAAKLLGSNNDGWLFQQDGGGPGLLGIWQMWAAVTDLKIHIKKQIDGQLGGSEVRAFINGEESHEGYVFGAGKNKLKIIDRLGFSAANFAKHKVSDEEQQAKSQMPLAAFCFGRMNPPTAGHGAVMQKTVETGAQNSFIFVSSSQGPDDPLDYATKVAFIKKIYPQYAQYIAEPVTNPIFGANAVYDKGFRNMAFIAGSDRLGKEKGSVEKTLRSWNSGPVRTTDNARGAGGREHVNLNFVSSGQRDPDASGLEGVSGTKAREAAKAGNEQLFQQFTGVGNNIVVNGQTLYQATRAAIGIKDQEPVAQQPQGVQVTPKKTAAPTQPETLKPLPVQQPMQESRLRLHDLFTPSPVTEAKSIVDGIINQLIKKGRSKEEAIAELKKQVDKKFYDESIKRVIKGIIND